MTGAELGQAATNALEQVKRDNPTLSMKAFLAGGGLNEVLDQTIDRSALAEFGEKHGVIASDRLIDSEIAKIPAFQGPDGKFSDTAYKALLQPRGLTDATVRRDLGDGLIARQLLTPAALGAKAPAQLVTRYVSLLAERRSGAIALLPAAAFARLKADMAARWDLAAFDAEVRASQARRHVVYGALRNGAYFPWDHQPLQKASERYMRNHMDLNILEESKRYPRGE